MSPQTYPAFVPRPLFWDKEHRGERLWRCTTHGNIILLPLPAIAVEPEPHEGLIGICSGLSAVEMPNHTKIPNRACADDKLLACFTPRTKSSQNSTSLHADLWVLWVGVERGDDMEESAITEDGLIDGLAPSG